MFKSHFVLKNLKPPTFSTALMASWPTPELSQVAAWWKVVYLPLWKKYGFTISNIWKKNVPNHQPDSDTWWKYVDLISMDINSDHGFIMVIMGASPVNYLQNFWDSLGWTVHAKNFMAVAGWLQTLLGPKSSFDPGSMVSAKLSRWHLRIFCHWSCLKNRGMVPLRITTVSSPCLRFACHTSHGRRCFSALKPRVANRSATAG